MLAYIEALRNLRDSIIVNDSNINAGGFKYCCDYQGAVEDDYFPVDVNVSWIFIKIIKSDES